MAGQEYFRYPANMHPPMLPPPHHRFIWQQQHRPADGRVYAPTLDTTRERSSSLLSDGTGAPGAAGFQQSMPDGGPHRSRSTGTMRLSRERDETRRKNHIKSEQKRRFDINHHLARLRDVIPDAENSDSKAVTLVKTISHVEDLHVLLHHLGYEPSDLPNILSQLGHRPVSTLTSSHLSTAMEEESEPPTPSSVTSSAAGNSFFAEEHVAFGRSSSETEESDVEPQAKRRLSVKDLCI